MNEKQTSTASTVRPTKKQRELLSFIEAFIGEHGYSPSYREIMSGLNYTSVATVALHVNSLIKRGHLRKRDFNARSLEVVTPSEASTVTSNAVKPNEEKWLVDKVEHHFSVAESGQTVTPAVLQNLQVLHETLSILGLDGAAQSYVARLANIKKLPVAAEAPE
jgi:repressor LexA